MRSSDPPLSYHSLAPPASEGDTRVEDIAAPLRRKHVDRLDLTGARPATLTGDRCPTGDARLAESKFKPARTAGTASARVTPA